MKIKGLLQIIKFNRHFYLGAITLIFLLLLKIESWNGTLLIAANTALIVLIYFVFSSLLISWYIFDYRNIQNLEYIQQFQLEEKSELLNIHAGFDETSESIRHLFSSGKLSVLDFYEKSKHTEQSLKVARKLNSTTYKSENISTENIPRMNESVDYVFLIFSAHEIRDTKERNIFFKELHRILKQDGKIIMTEHLCDFANFMAYGPGAFHFWTEKTWLTCIGQAGMNVEQKIKITPWINCYLISKS